MRVLRRLTSVLTTLAVAAMMLVGINVATPANAAANWRPGTGDTAFLNQIKQNKGLDGAVHDLVVQPDGKVVVVGYFSSAGGRANVRKIARFNANGTPDTAFNSNIAAFGGLQGEAARAVAIQRNGQIVVTGHFDAPSGSAQGIARFNANGTRDTQFNTNVGAGLTGGDILGGQTVAIQSDGKIVVGGGFANVSGVSSPRVARLNTNGMRDGSFNILRNGQTALDNVVQDVLVQPNGQIVLAGFFTAGLSYGSLSRLARVSADGASDGTFNGVIATSGGVNGNIFSVARQSNGKLVVGGAFTSAPGTPNVNRIARFNPGGSADDSFNDTVRKSAGADGTVNAIQVQSDGKLIVVGAFTSFAGQSSVNRLARLNGNGAPDAAFNNAVRSSTGLHAYTRAVGIQSTGKIVVAGDFTQATNVTGVNRLARFNNNISKPNKPAALKVSGKRTAKTFKASWKAPSGATTTRPVTRYTVRVTVKGKKKVLITKHLSASKLRYNLKRSALNKALRKNKFKRANNYRFTVRVVASNQMGSSSAAAKAFRMRR